MTGYDSAAHDPAQGETGRPGWLRAAEYGAAALLAWAAVAVGFHLPAFRDIRLSLTFCVIAAAALTGGIGPAVTAIGVSMATVLRYPRSWAAADPVSVARIVPVATLGLAVGLLLVIAQRKHLGERRLRKLVHRLREQSDALARAQQANRSAAWIFDAVAHRMRWYEGGAEIFGRPHREVAAIANPVSLVLDEDRERVTATFEHALRTGEPLAVEFRVAWPSGEIRWLEARAVPLKSNPQIWRGATIDVTERKRAEQALLQNEKLAIAGRLAASIAHEINNPLEAVTNLCYLARVTSKSEESIRYIRMAEDELARVAQITTQTLRFHRQQSAPADTDLGELAGSVLALYEQKLAERSIRARLETRPAPPLRCYAGEIRQVLANLVGNAIDAMPDGGLLRVSVRQATDRRGGRRAVRISIADSGPGISPETMQRIFEPFYTTKGELGTGLGLWVSATLLEKHRGRVAVRTSVRPGRAGTVFSIVLPYPAEGSKG
jgi:PAS domain S-box-containing protein